MKHLMEALNAAYDEEEGRGFLKVRGVALLLTLGAVVFVVAAVVVLTVVPAAVEGSVLGNAAKTALNIARWPVLAVSFAAALRSEERRVGTECVSACRSRWLPSL